MAGGSAVNDGRKLAGLVGGYWNGPAESVARPCAGRISAVGTRLGLGGRGLGRIVPRERRPRLDTYDGPYHHLQVAGAIAWRPGV